MSVREMVRGMKKKEAIELMTDYMMELNLEAAKLAGMKENEYKAQLSQLYPQIYMVNEKVFDLMKSKDLIKNVD